MSGSLLLSCTEVLPEPDVKNTFIHFNTRKRELTRCHTSPAEVDSASTDLCHSPSASAVDSSSTCSDLTPTECLSPRSCASPTPDSGCLSPRISGISTPEECFTPPQRFSAFHLQLALALQAPTPKSLEFPAGSQESSHHSITLRRDDEVELGLDLRSDDSPGLSVFAVTSGGAAEAWNKQCRSEARQILPGDRLLSVNEAKTEESMREEARSKLLLRLTLQRGPGRAAGQSTAAAAFYPWFGGIPEMMPALPEFPYVGGAEPWAWQWPTCAVADMQVGAEPKLRGAITRFEWVEEASRLCGKGTRVTKSQQLECGEFAFTIHAQQTSDKRGGLSFLSSKGRGMVHVKCNSDSVGKLAVTVSLADGTISNTVIHDFARDSICRVPEVFDFSRAVKPTEGTFTVAFALAQVFER